MTPTEEPYPFGRFYEVQCLGCHKWHDGHLKQCPKCKSEQKTEE